MNLQIVWCFVTALALIGRQSALAARNNILLVIADDYGTDSSSLYNNDPQASLPPTPNLNSLYDSGVLFRNAYAYPSCSPTRASILTGRYGFRTGWGLAVGEPGNRELWEGEPTIPKILMANPQLGYRHASFGKWHLGFNPTDPNVLGGWSHFSGALSYGVESYSRWSKVVDGVRTTSTNYATTDNVNDALSWIQQQGTNNWFLWLAFNAPHDPFHKPPSGLHSYESLSPAPSAVSQNPRPYYEAMTEAMDKELGRFLSHLDRSMTTIIFVGDNGTPGEVIQPPFDTGRAKFTLFEGGIRVPMIISGPVVQNPRRETTNLVHVVDLFATILELAGADLQAALPANVPFDSRSLVPALTDNALPPRDWVFTEQFPAPPVIPAHHGRVIRDNRFKLLQLQTGFQGFYDLWVDPYEKTNLLDGSLTDEQSAHIEVLRSRLGELQNIPRVTSFAHRSNRTSITLDYIPGARFSLRRSDGLSNSWRTVPASQQRTNSSVTLTDSNATNPAAFYRVAAPRH